MTDSRSSILSKLRSARRPFRDAAPRPEMHAYQPVTVIEDTTTAGLLERFRSEVEALHGCVHVVSGHEEAREQVMALLRQYQATSVLAWHFTHIPVDRLHVTIRTADIEVLYPETTDDSARAEALERFKQVPVGITGADAAIATTGTLVVSSGHGKARLPTVLPPVHIAIINETQILARLEDWVAAERANGMNTVLNSANVCFISGPSRTADIEKILVLGVHGPRNLHVIVKQVRAGRPSKGS